MMLKLVKSLLTFLVCSCPAFAYFKTYSVSEDHNPLSKIAIKDTDLYISGKNLFINLDLNLTQRGFDTIGPVNDSKQCKPFDLSCIYRSYDTVDNYVSILKPYRSYIILCGTARQGLCYRYNKSNISDKMPFKLELKNYLGSQNSSVMHLTSSNDGVDMFFIGQSYDGRKLDFFYKEFATLDLNGDRSNFGHYAAHTHLSVCDSKKDRFQIKFLYIFEAKDYIFHVFIRSMNSSDFSSYETRISMLCKNNNDYSSYEEMPVSCTTPKKYDIGLSAHFDGSGLYMTFGVKAHDHGIFEADKTQGSVICFYNIEQLITKFTNEVLTKCFSGLLLWGTPSWQCTEKACPRAGIDFFEDEGEEITACGQKNMTYGIEAHGDGYSKTAFFETANELLVSVTSLQSKPEQVVVGTNTGFIRKIRERDGLAYASFDVSKDRTIPVSGEMVLDMNQNLYVMSDKTVTKVSMTSCELHQTCGECITSQDPLRCGWCYDRCSTQSECQQQNWHDKSCPPSVRSIKPLFGPVEGFTKLTINGENFGSAHGNAYVKIGSSQCDIKAINDTSISCLTSPVGLPMLEIVQVQVVDTSNEFIINGTSEQTNNTFTYMESKVVDFYPKKGPLSGETLITIEGQNFHIGSNWSVMIGEVLCDIQRRNHSLITCLTRSCLACAQISNGNDGYHICLHTGDLKVKIDGGTYIPQLENKTFCYMHNPDVDSILRSKTIRSGGTEIIIFGKWFDSVTNHGIGISVNGGDVKVPCQPGVYSTQMTCLVPDLKPYTNFTNHKVDGEMTVLLDNRIHFTNTIKIYPDPELEKLNTQTDVKDIDLKEKILELKGKHLNLALSKEDYLIRINGSRCNVIELYEDLMKCNLSDVVQVQGTPLLVEVFAGKTWHTSLGYLEFIHMPRPTNSAQIMFAAIGLGFFALLIISLLYVMRKKHLAWFKKREQEVFLVEYHNSNGNTGEHSRLMGTRDNVTNDTNDAETTPRYVKQQRGSEVNSVGGATGGDYPKTGFDAFETADFLKQQNIFIERDRVRLGEDIGHGNFGCVYKGFLLTVDGREQLVAVKTVLKTGTQDVTAFLDEAMIMKDFEHPNVLSLVGISVAPGEFPLVILPYMANGDLLSYIRSEDNKPTVKDLVRFGLDVAKGMDYLGSIKFVHRDLAARNCMLDESMKVKVADFGLARDIYTKNYYSSDNKKMLPVKWMAPESLENGTYSIKSDVWSFGVVMWELMTRGAVPYCDVDNWDMLKYLEHGRRLKTPKFCPPQLYNIMLTCWKMEPENRPNFHDITQTITDLVEQ